jgi:aryl-alcohol dehydrogenase-like predicted oxidoreductase
MMMDKRSLGNTGLMVSRLGMGLSEIGSLSPITDKTRASKVLNTALDQGINFLDTAACYGNSEELVGQSISTRRDEFYLATKAGHAVEDDGQPWTFDTVRESIDRSLRRLRTDHVDIVQLHSCDVDILEKGDVIEALQDAKQQGKTRFIGYSGDNESAVWAVESGMFDTLQTSFNLVDQKARNTLFAKAEKQGMGIIAKRPIANAVWGTDHSPSSYASEYFRRYEIMVNDGSLPPSISHEPIVVSLDFVLSHDAVDTAIVGTSNPQHMKKNIQWVEDVLPIDSRYIQQIRQRFDEVGSSWDQKG